MRARNIKPGFFKNEELAECSPQTRLLFAGLWMLADREGRLIDRPKRIKVEIFPYEDCDIASMLDELENRGFILRYRAEGGEYLQIARFSAHQRPHRNEAKSIIPPRPEPGIPEDCPVAVPCAADGAPRYEGGRTMEESASPYISDSLNEDSLKEDLPEGGPRAALPEAALSRSASKGEKPQRQWSAPRRTPAEKEADATLDGVVELWNERLGPLGFRKVRAVSPGREGNFRARIEAEPVRTEARFWEAVIGTVAESVFLRSAPWFGMDWLLAKEERLLKLLEGCYDNAEGRIFEAGAEKSDG